MVVKMVVITDANRGRDRIEMFEILNEKIYLWSFYIIGVR